MKRAIFLVFLLMLVLLVVTIGNQAIAKDNLTKEELLAMIVLLEQRVEISKFEIKNPQSAITNVPSAQSSMSFAQTRPLHTFFF